MTMWSVALTLLLGLVNVVTSIPLLSPPKDPPCDPYSPYGMNPYSKQCQDPCNYYPCARYPKATCKIDKCQCTATYYDGTTQVDCSKCNCMPKCPTTYAVVCASDDRSYPNECQMNRASCVAVQNGKQKITTKYDGPCCSTGSTSCAADVIEEMCGSDGKTYKNACYLMEADCDSRKANTGAVSLAYYGPCCDASVSCSSDVDSHCGTDGKDYTNMCLLKKADCIARQAGKAGVDAHYEGECCSTVEDCPSVYKPVCTTAGDTYANKCELKKADCSARQCKLPRPAVQYKGECCNAAMSCVGSDKVCGSDGKDYVNYCELLKKDCEERQAGRDEIYLVHDGECCDLEDCGSEIEPVCGCNGETYDNPCKMRNAACEERRKGKNTIVKSYDGECCDPTESCDSDTSPALCADDLRTYPNECELRIANCLRSQNKQEAILKLYTGECCDDSMTCDSTLTYGVCDMNGNSYDNLCELRKADCTGRKAGDAMIVIEHGDDCCDDNVDCSSEAIVILCDTDGVSHDTECALLNAACSNIKAGLAPVEKDYEGECCSYKTACPTVYMPVCADNGETYYTYCDMQNADCYERQMGNNAVKQLYEGECCDEAESCDVTTLSASDNLEVCGTDGKSHANLCERRVADCKLRQAGKTGIDIAYVGPCCKPDIDCDNAVGGPVCGCDGMSYDNMCKLNKAACKAKQQGDAPVEKRHMGECCSVTASCPVTYDPVCGSDGVSYPNPCQLRLADCLARQNDQPTITMQYKGQCCDANANCPAGAVVDKVCGKDGMTYETICHLEVKDCELRQAGDPGIQLDYQGECCDASVWIPVCGSDGKTYQSECHMKTLTCGSNIVVTKSYEGECCDSSVQCDNTRNSVCGSNGLSYPNKCELKKADCSSRRSNQNPILLAYNGDCCTPSTTSCPASSPTNPPVCGCDGANYPSQCHLEQESCEQRQGGKAGIKKVYDGECCSLGPCTGDYEPLCGSDNNDYASQCEMDQANCVARRLGLTIITSAYPGECCDSQVQCSDTKQVCGTDGTTYTECELEKADCLLRQDTTSTDRLQLQYHGACCTIKTCTTIDKVCGTNGLSYDSECVLDNAACEARQKGEPPIEIWHEGECCSYKDCSLDGYGPVCGDDGITYYNDCYRMEEECVLRQSGDNTAITVDYDGVCCDENENCNPADTNYVCAAGGDTYDNICELRKADCAERQAATGSVSLAYNGPCCSQQSCAGAAKKIMCACNGKTYTSQCEVENADCEARMNGEPSVEILYDGECCAIAMCDSDDHEPMCGSDNYNYHNDCDLKNANCLASRNGKDAITVAYYGYCCDASVSCSSDVDSHCGTDGKDYTNMCLLKKADCIARQAGKAGVDVHYKGECCQPEACTNTYTPVCGSDGVTYDNQCALKNKACEARKECEAELTQEYEGKCCYAMCTPGSNPVPVCSKDGTTYPSKCDLEKADCSAQREGKAAVEYDYEGLCCEENANCDGDANKVCDKNGVTHDNVCALRKYQCKQRKAQQTVVQLDYDGPCCSDAYDPVCTTDGVDYHSQCYLEKDNCRKSRDGMQGGKQMDYKGKCCKINNCSGGLTGIVGGGSKPVCGSDGTTYDSYCELQNKDCSNRKAGQQGVTKVGAGSCDNYY